MEGTGFCRGGVLQAAEEHFLAVILSEAKNLCIFGIRQMQRSFVGRLGDLLRMTALAVIPQPVETR